MTRLVRLALLFVVFPPLVGAFKLWSLYGTPFPADQRAEAMTVFWSYVTVTLAALLAAAVLSLWAAERKRLRTE